MTLNKSGNGLNYNSHVHLIGTMEIVDIKTGEVFENIYMPYKTIRHVWQAGFFATSCCRAGRFASCFLKAFLNHLVKKKIISEDEHIKLDERYKNGLAAPLHPCNRGTKTSVLPRSSSQLFQSELYSPIFHNVTLSRMRGLKVQGGGLQQFSSLSPNGSGQS